MDNSRKVTGGDIMQFLHGKGMKILVNQYDISTFMNKIDSPRPIDSPETTTFGKNDKCYIPGAADATIGMEGFWDGNVGAIDEILEKTFGAASNTKMSWYYKGDSIEEAGYAANLIHNAYNVTSTLDNAVKISAGGQSVVGRERVISLFSTTVAMTGTGVTATTPVDLGATGNGGGAAYLHVTALNGGSISSFAVQHASTQDGGYTDVATFVAPTGATAQRVEIATGTDSIKRWVKISASGTKYDINFNIGINKK